MASDETRRLLKTFGVAVTNLEDAIEEKRPAAELHELDTVLADRTRELLSLLRASAEPPRHLTRPVALSAVRFT
jgi:hypothetical protein